MILAERAMPALGRAALLTASGANAAPRARLPLEDALRHDATAQFTSA